MENEQKPFNMNYQEESSEKLGYELSNKDKDLLASIQTKIDKNLCKRLEYDVDGLTVTESSINDRDSILK